MTPRPNDRITDNLPEFAARFRDYQAAQDAIPADPPGIYRPIERQRMERMSEVADFKQACADCLTALCMVLFFGTLIYVAFAL
jgi:hypothetical protein